MDLSLIFQACRIPWNVLLQPASTASTSHSFRILCALCVLGGEPPALGLQSVVGSAAPGSLAPPVPLGPGLPPRSSHCSNPCRPLPLEAPFRRTSTRLAHSQNHPQLAGYRTVPGLKRTFISLERFQLAGGWKDPQRRLDHRCIQDIRTGWGGWLGAEGETVEFSVCLLRLGRHLRKWMPRTGNGISESAPFTLFQRIRFSANIGVRS